MGQKQGGAPGTGPCRADRFLAGPQGFVGAEIVDDRRRVVETPVKPAFVVMERSDGTVAAPNLAMIAEAVFDIAVVRRGEAAEECRPRATVWFAVPGLEGAMDCRVYEGDAAIRLRRAIELNAAEQPCHKAAGIMEHLSRAA